MLKFKIPDLEQLQLTPVESRYLPGDAERPRGRGSKRYKGPGLPKQRRLTLNLDYLAPAQLSFVVIEMDARLRRVNKEIAGKLAAYFSSERMPFHHGCRL